MDVVFQATSMILALVKVKCLSSKKVHFFPFSQPREKVLLLQCIDTLSN